MSRYLFLIIFFFGCLHTLANGIETDTITYEKFGKVFIYKPASPPKELVLFVSGDAGWKYGVINMAKELAARGALVAGIDILRYWKNVQNTSENCLYASADFQALNNVLQKKYKFSTYREPILFGYSSGATLIYGLMAQAPLEIYKGGVALGFCPDIIGKKPLCEGSGLHYTVLPRGNGYDLLPRKDLTTAFSVLIGEKDHICDVEHTSAFMKQIPGGKLYRLSKVGHGFSKPADWMPQMLKAYNAIARIEEDHSNADGLPVVEVPCTGNTGQPLLIGISGDGGWKGYIDNVGKDLATHGIPVVGIDALRYFWKAKDPDETAKDLARAIRYYLKKWNRDSFVLLGYSFGADVMPYAVNRLPEDLKARLKMVVLLSPSNYADFEFHFSSWLNQVHSRNFPVLPELEKMKAVHTIIFYGKEEPKKPAAPLAGGSIEVVMVNGDHHYNYDHASMSGIIVKKTKERESR
jgi:type IV secretory pathway VirJ component